MGRSLIDEFNAADLDQSEFTYAIQEYYRGASHHTGKQLTFGHADNKVSLTLTHTKDGRLQEIKRGPHFKKEDIAGIKSCIQSSVLTEHGKKVARRVAFSCVPTRSFYRWRDQFQIVPVPDHAPQPKAPFMGGFPALIEVSYAASPNMMIEGHRAERQLRMVEGLLMPILPRCFQLASNQLVSHWTREEGPEGIIGYDYRFSGYGYDGYDQRSEAFTSVDDMRRATRAPDREVYGPWGIDENSEFEIPVSLPVYLLAFERLSAEDRTRYLRSAFWLKHARKVQAESKSAEFVAYISALESLIERRPLVDGAPDDRPTADFKELIQSHLPPGSVSRNELDRLYEARSDLSHGSQHFLYDELYFHWHARALLERNDTISLGEIACAVIREWLRRRGEPAYPVLAPIAGSQLFSNFIGTKSIT